MTRFVGDLGAVDVERVLNKSRTVEIVLFVDYQNTRWKITVYKGDFVTVHKLRPGSTPDNDLWLTVFHDDRDAKIVVGYALRRAICRGIDKCEVTETTERVDIDLGKISW